MSTLHVHRTQARRLIQYMVGFTVAAALAFFPADAQAKASTNGKNCQDLTVPVTLAADQTTTYSLYGRLCTPQAGPGHTVQLLIHGATSDHLYWDFGTVNGYDYSYVDSAVESYGYSTFDIDRISVGQSAVTPPLPSTSVSIGADAYIAHELVQGLRSGTIGGTGFTHVIEIGHSLGSLIAQVEEAQYQDVDGVVLTSGAPPVSQNGLSQIHFYPATNDPKFQNSGLDSGYLTTVPRNRTVWFYTPTADPAVMSQEEAGKQTVTGTELQGQGQAQFTSTPAQVTVPILVVLGQQDPIFCNTDAVDCSSSHSAQDQLAPLYPNAPSFQATVMGKSGHFLNLHKTAYGTFAVINRWALNHNL